MNARMPKYDKDVHAEMAEKIYTSTIKPKVDPTHFGRVVAIDVDSGDYEIADDSREASMSLRARRPESQTFCRRIGPDSAVTRFGYSSVRATT